MTGEGILILLIVIGFLGKSNVIAMAACILLAIKLSRLDSLLPLLERRGVEVGLLFLLLAVLVPFADGKVPPKDLLRTFTTFPGIFALVGGALATHLNGKGINLLTLQPELMIGLVIGSIMGIVFWGGVPVGPLMAGGITAFLLELFHRFG
jgi:uncharacterized membrane protein (DUF441 family)